MLCTDKQQQQQHEELFTVWRGRGLWSAFKVHTGSSPSSYEKTQFVEFISYIFLGSTKCYQLMSACLRSHPKMCESDFFVFVFLQRRRLSYAQQSKVWQEDVLFLARHDTNGLKKTAAVLNFSTPFMTSPLSPGSSRSSSSFTLPSSAFRAGVRPPHPKKKRKKEEKKCARLVPINAILAACSPCKV